jgi:hypothetical protein
LLSGVPEQKFNRQNWHAAENHRTGKQRATTSNSQGGQVAEAKTCSCGSPVMSARGAVSCHNIVSISLSLPLKSTHRPFFCLLACLLTNLTSQHCPRVQYHMTCVGLARRPENWQCPDCSTRMDTSGGG